MRYKHHPHRVILRIAKPPRKRSKPAAAAKAAAPRPRKRASRAASRQPTETAATVPRKHDVSLGTTTQQSAAAEGTFHAALEDVLRVSDTYTATVSVVGFPPDVSVGFPPEAQRFREEINRLANEILSELAAMAGELRQAEADLRSELLRGNKANLIRSYGYDNSSNFPTVATVTARLDGESRALLEQVGRDRPAPWTLKLIHRRLDETKDLLAAITTVLEGFGATVKALTKLMALLGVLIGAVIGLLHILGGL
jgi:hypothetical protein